MRDTHRTETAPTCGPVGRFRADLGKKRGEKMSVYFYRKTGRVFAGFEREDHAVF